MKLTESTVSAIATPGAIHNHGVSMSTVGDCAALIISPQLGTGTLTPRPRNDSPASRMIALATPNVARTASELMMFGIRCRNRISGRAHADDPGGHDVLRFAEAEQLAADEPARARASRAGR